MQMEPYDLDSFGLSGKEDYIILDNAKYPPELYVEDDSNEEELLDLHAGAFETATMEYFYPDAVRKGIARQLESYSLTESGLSVWISGGENVKSVVPLGYAGNPAGYEKNTSIVEPIFDILADYCAKQITEFNLAK